MENEYAEDRANKPSIARWEGEGGEEKEEEIEEDHF